MPAKVPHEKIKAHIADTEAEAEMPIKSGPARELWKGPAVSTATDTVPVPAIAGETPKHCMTNGMNRKAYERHVRVQVPLPEYLEEYFEERKEATLVPVSLQITTILADYYALRKAGVIRHSLSELLTQQ